MKPWVGSAVAFGSLLTLLLAFVMGLIYYSSGGLDPRSALQVVPANEVPVPVRFTNTVASLCSEEGRGLCLTVEHLEDSVKFVVLSYDVNPDFREVRLTTFVTLSRHGGELLLEARHFVTLDFWDDLVDLGTDLNALHKRQTLYRVTGWGPWTNAEVLLPFGVLPQFFFDGFQSIDRALEYETEVSELAELAGFAANQVNERFGLSEVASRALTSQIAQGPIQTLSYVVALFAVVFTVLEIRRPSLKTISDGMADLIPFTGFFGTLIGVGQGLQVLGQSDVTDDVQKALALGKIGSSLGLAINTTILAIIVFALTLVIQYLIRFPYREFAKGSD